MERPVAIVANGELGAAPEVLAALGACRGCVCCDRLPPAGAPELLQVVGDLDTLGGAAGLPAGLVCNLSGDQETNDLWKAMAWVRAHCGACCVRYFAVTGGREDHTLGNLALIEGAGAPAEVYTAAGKMALLPAGRHAVAVEGEGGAISFFSFARQRITARGVVWPVEGLELDALWRAMLNRATGGQVEVVCEVPVWVYQPWRKR